MPKPVDIGKKKKKNVQFAGNLAFSRFQEHVSVLVIIAIVS